MSIAVHGTSHGSNDFSSQQTKRWMDVHVIVLCFVVRYFMSILVLQSS